jgi:hypothetical protein
VCDLFELGNRDKGLRLGHILRLAIAGDSGSRLSHVLRLVGAGDILSRPNSSGAFLLFERPVSFVDGFCRGLRLVLATRRGLYLGLAGVQA